jgi:hypothetical protein
MLLAMLVRNRKITMDGLNPTVAATVTAIESEFGSQWGVWLSDTGQWWAARTRAMTVDEEAAGSVPYIQASDPGELRQRIRDEEALLPDQRARQAGPQA